MPPRKKPEQLDLVEQANALPAVGHNSQVTDEDLIAENFKLEDLIAAATAKLNEWAKPHKARIAEIEGDLRTRLTDRKADSTKTEAGTAYFSHLMNTKIEDNAKLFDFAADNWEEVGGDVKISVPLATVKAHMESNEGKPPPGVSVSYYSRLNIRRN